MSKTQLDHIVQRIAQALQLNTKNISNVIEMLEEGMTVPFIARYRKERTGSMQDFQIIELKKQYELFLQIIKRRDSILGSIEEQGKLTAELEQKIKQCWELADLEDLYLPYKRKKQTRAEKARQKGLESLAKIIMSQRNPNIDSAARNFLKNGVASIEEAIQGAQDIIAEWISENPGLRKRIRKKYHKEAQVHSKVIEKKRSQAQKYEMYFDHREHALRAPSHRVLAMLRGEQEDLLRIKFLVDQDELWSMARRIYVKRDNYSEQSIEIIEDAIQDSLKRLIVPSIENELKSGLKEKAEVAAIDVFSANLRDLLMAAPLGSKWILSIDPGFRTGCKVVVLDPQGNLIDKKNIFPHPPQSNTWEASKAIEDLIRKHTIEAIAIGDGTAGIETYQWLNSILSDDNVQVYFISESGASVYSGSELARKEFPNEDITVRGAVSIGRRLMDPLSELIKIDPKSIGVGQYQHDINQTKLRDSLDQTIEQCVNQVGINLNTASSELLRHVSGLGPKLAENIINYRKENGAIRNKKQLLSIPKFGPKAYQQSAGFLRIKNAENPLDDTSVHPESYSVVKNIAGSMGVEIKDMIQNQEVLDKIHWREFVSGSTGMPTLMDIKNELLKPNLDPRGEAKPLIFEKGLKELEDLRTGMILNGIVSNITKFGAFVNLGIKESGLVHVSEIADQFIKDPRELLHIDQNVRVKVLHIDTEKRRIGLSIKQA